MRKILLCPIFAPTAYLEHFRMQKSGKAIKEAMVRMSMASFTPIYYFEEMTLNELSEYAGIIANNYKN